MGVDLDDDYEKVNGRVKALKAYKDLKNQYEKAVKKTGDAFEKRKTEVSEKLSSAKQKKDALTKKAKNQFQKLLDLSRLTGGKGTNTINLLKRAFIRTIEKIKPELEKILISEMIKALGCDQQQTYLAQDVYIKVSSIDLFASLKEEPESEIGKLFYEKLPVQYQSRPFSMNRELYNRIQSSNTYSGDTGQLYLGASGQPLFDIKFFDIHPLTGEPGGWYRVSLVNRVTNFNLVYQFLSDYFKTITVFDFKSVMASIMDLISGAISIKANIGLQQIEDSSKFSLLIQRVLGLCFDNATEIDVTGSAKLDTTGQEVNNNFFEFDEIDLRTIESRISNIKNGVVVFEDCDNVALPVNTQDIINSLLTLNEDTDQIKAAENLTSTMSSNPAWGLNLNATFDFQINYDFLNFLCEGIIRALLSPKIILPFMTMYKAISSSINNAIVDTINSYFFFFQKFKGFMINLVSRIGSIFVRELVDIIKKDILELVKTIVLDITKERAKGILTVILKLAQFLIIGLQLIDDWRKCRSVIDDILNALNLAISTFGLKVPAPLLSLSQFLDGYSETRAFIGTVEELQKIGVPTDSMPDGSPNLDVLAKFAQIKAMNSEQLENGYIATYSEQTYSTPSGYVLRSSTFGKSF